MHIDTAGENEILDKRERSTTARLTGKSVRHCRCGWRHRRGHRRTTSARGCHRCRRRSEGALGRRTFAERQPDGGGGGGKDVRPHLQEVGRIDVLFNNAGLNDPNDHLALDMTLETWERVFAANLTTTFLSCKHGIPYLLRNDPPSGSVINTASFLAVMGAATSQMAYSAAKAAVIQLSRDLGTNLARRGVRVNALCLGPIETPQLRQLFDSLPPEELPKRLIHYPMGRFGTLDELAGTVAYLASDDSGFVTASAFPINGGITSAFTVPS
jgi:NAD(P)-dependent dehydrogenase (short-subunit alcohol dehydrogenase family)